MKSNLKKIGETILYYQSNIISLPRNVEEWTHQYKYPRKSKNFESASVRDTISQWNSHTREWLDQFDTQPKCELMHDVFSSVTWAWEKRWEITCTEHFRAESLRFEDNLALLSLRDSAGNVTRGVTWERFIDSFHLVSDRRKGENISASSGGSWRSVDLAFLCPERGERCIVARSRNGNYPSAVR